MRRAQCFDQIGCFALELNLNAHQPFDLFGKACVSGGAGRLDFLDFRINFLQRLFERLDDLFDGSLPGAQVRSGVLLELFQSGFGQGQK